MNQVSGNPQQLPAVNVRVGDKPVIDARVIVLGRGEPSLTLSIENLRIELVFITDPGGLVVDTQIVDETLMRIRFTGHIGALGVSYELPNAAMMFGRWVHLAIIVHAIEDDAIIRQVAYTLTWTEYPQ